MEDSLRSVAFESPSPGRMSLTETVRGVLVSMDPVDDGVEYLVEGRVTERLARHLDKGVVAWGSVRRDDRGRRVLRVRGFDIVHG